MKIEANILTAGLLFLFTLGSGLWLSLLGRPYNGILFNIHKIIALVVVIITARQLYKAVGNTDIHTIAIILGVMAGLCVIALFVTGALMSIGKLNYNLVLTVHRMALILMIIIMPTIVYFLVGKKL